MKTFYGIILIMLFYFPSTAQPSVSFRSSEKEIDISAHVDSAFLFIPAETTRAFIFKDGKKESKNLQYNILTNKMQHADLKGKVQYLKNTDNIDSIAFPEQVFIKFPQEGYLQLINKGKLSLLKKHSLKVQHEIIKEGPYGSRLRTSNTSIYHTKPEGTLRRSYSARNDMIIENEGGHPVEVVLDKNTSYFLKQDNRLIEIDNRRSLLSHFKEHRNAVKEFLKKEKLDLKNEQDLIRLSEFLSRL